jgi:hypothetical protein
MSDNNIKKQNEESVSSGIVWLLVVTVLGAIFVVLKLGGLF